MSSGQRRILRDRPEIAPELTGHGLPLSKCEAYNRIYEQPYESRRDHHVGSAAPALDCL
jgi:hypothetical protein